MKLRMFIFILDLGLFLYFDNVLFLYLALFMGVSMFLEELYDRAPKISKEDLNRIEKAAADEYNKILKEIENIENVKHVQGEDLDEK